MHNVNLPIGYSHVTVPNTDSWSTSRASARDWINAYSGGKVDAATIPGGDDSHVLWAADVWHSVKKHWCLEAQRLFCAQRASDESRGSQSALR